MAFRTDLKIAVIGGGITGLCLAIALHHRGLTVNVYEQAPSFGEIGAGVAFTKNAVQAMKICHQGIFEAFEKVRTRNMWPSKQKVWFDYHDGYHDVGELPRAAFTISNDMGQAGVHRARFLDELVKLFPPELSHFGKRLDSISEDQGGLYTMRFAEGTIAQAHAILAGDGIKSRVRQLMFGVDHPCAFPTYTYKYAYRALAPMEDAIAALGEEKAQNACMHMGPSGHILTFPIDHGRIMNVVAFRTTTKDWPDSSKLTMPATREDALRDFDGFAPYIKKLLELTKPDLDIWAIFHTGDNPVPRFNQDRICLVGDAAHASSPHHGAGAGMCIEDSAVMASLLADDRVITSQDLETVFAVYDSVRRERGQWLVQSSQHIGNCYEWLGKGVGDNFQKIEAEINTRLSIISDADVAALCDDARALLGERLGGSANLA